ncbi:hypothetical protein BGW80DRAFT_1338433 [Lactifluus volemus]|nr:hypothetical protein BGW80DRAFT_1338433 [Lactifluus volemus]
MYGHVPPYANVAGAGTRRHYGRSADRRHHHSGPALVPIDTLRRHARSQAFLL